MKIFLMFLTLTLGLNGLLSCSEIDEFGLEKKTSLKEARALLEELKQNIEAIALDKSCDGLGDCKVLAYGQKACGGPTAYVIYNGEIDEELLVEKCNEYTLLEGEINRRFGLVSDCSLLIVPEVTCVEGKCVIIE
ncbi:hypothetical protein ACV07N_04970 [Roseivirga echinicomitans]